MTHGHNTDANKLGALRLPATLLVKSWLRQIVMTCLVCLTTSVVASGQQWSQQLQLLPSDPRFLNAFGVDVAIERDRLLVGAFDQGPGAAYVFDLTTGEELFKLTPSDGRTGDGFGLEIAIKGNRAVIAARQVGSSTRGKAYVFDINTGEELFKLLPSDSAPEQYFGSDIAMNSSTAVITGGGNAYVFDLSTGEERFTLQFPDPAPTRNARVEIIDDLVVASISGAAAFVFDLATGEHNYTIPDIVPSYISTDGESLLLISRDADSDSRSAHIIDVKQGVETQQFDLLGTSYSTFGNAKAGDVVAVHEMPFHPANDVPADSTFHFFDATTGDLIDEFIPPIDQTGGSARWNPIAMNETTVALGIRRALVEQLNDLETGSVFILQDASIQPGDFNRDRALSHEDVDLLTSGMRNTKATPMLDLNGDLSTDGIDLSLWVHDSRNTYFGDANLDREFNTADLVTVFVAGEYEDDIASNSSWATGDWNGDGEFNTSDLVKAFEDGGYEQGPRAAAIPTPEPSALTLVMGLVCVLSFFRTSQRLT